MSTVAAAAPQPVEDSDTLIPSLPNDIAINILARVPRCQHPILSLVSKPFKSLLTSPFFFTTRRLIGSAEPCLYLILRAHSSRSLLSFTLRCDPSKQRCFVPIASIPSPHSIGSAYAAIGPELYVLGGSINDVGSPRVWILDCRVNTWRAGPSMRVGREFPAAGVVDGKLYVMGGCVADTWARAANWTEVLDPAANGSWAPVSSPTEVREKWMHASVVMGGKMYAMADRGGVLFDPQTGDWDVVGGQLDMGWRGRASVVDGVLYCYDYLGKIRGFDVESRVWKELKGVEHGLPRFLCGATMANMGGNLVVVWEGKNNGSRKEMEVLGAEIVVRKESNGDLIGEIQWSDSLLKVPAGSSIVNCLAVAV